MKPTLFLLVLSVAIAAQTGPRSQYFGDRSKGEFYPIACGASSSISSENWIVFDSREDAERRGFQFMPCPVVSDPAKLKPVKAARLVTMTRVPLPRIAAMTSEPSKWLGKLLMIDADAKISDGWQYGHNTYAFLISDSSGSCYLYMDRSAARSLRELIMEQPSTGVVHGQFTFYLDPAGYKDGSNLYARLNSYHLKSN